MLKPIESKNPWYFIQSASLKLQLQQPILLQNILWEHCQWEQFACAIMLSFMEQMKNAKSWQIRICHMNLAITDLLSPQASTFFFHPVLCHLHEQL